MFIRCIVSQQGSVFTLGNCSEEDLKKFLNQKKDIFSFKKMSSKTQEKSKWTKDRTPTKEEHISWKSRIQKANSSKWTPELKKEFARQARTFQLAELRKKKCKRMFKSNAVARNAWATGMSMWTPTSANFRAAPAKERETRTYECLGTMRTYFLLWISHSH